MALFVGAHWTGEQWVATAFADGYESTTVYEEIGGLWSDVADDAESPASANGAGEPDDEAEHEGPDVRVRDEREGDEQREGDAPPRDALASRGRAGRCHTVISHGSHR